MAIRILLQPFFYLPEAWNGIDEHILLLRRHLDPGEFELILCVNDSDGPQTRTLACRAGMETVSVPSRRSPRQLVEWLAFYRRIQPAVVHMHTPSAGGQAVPALAARITGAAPVLTVHQYQPWAVPARTRVLNRGAQWFAFKRVIAVSQDVRASLAERAGVRASGVRVIPNGIDEALGHRSTIHLPATPGGPVRIGYFGRLSREKGVDLLIEGLALARRETQGFHLFVAGDGPERQRLERLARDRGLQSHVTFLGFVGRAKALMREVDLVAHTPRYEGFGLVILEAMAAARPVIVSPAPGGIAEMVVHGQTGLIAADSSAEAIAREVLILLASPDARRRMGEAGRERWRENFTAHQMAAHTAAVYREVLQSRTRAQRRAATAPTA